MAVENNLVYIMVSEHGITKYLMRIDEGLLTRPKDGDANVKDTLMDHLALLTDHLAST
jgi:hemerythrin-like domain-containing protein